jgi:dihydroxyacetone kinase-like predicted kinase
MDLVESISVYKSIKDSKFAGIKIPVNHYFAVMNGNVIAVDEKFDPVVISSVRGADPDERMTVSFYYNDNVKPDDLEPITAKLEEEFEDLEFETHYGGQHTALLLIGLE